MRLIRLLLVDFIRKTIACATYSLDIVGKPKWLKHFTQAADMHINGTIFALKNLNRYDYD